MQREPIGYMETLTDAKLSLLGEPQLQVGMLAQSGLCFRTTSGCRGAKAHAFHLPAHVIVGPTYLAVIPPEEREKLRAKLFKSETVLLPVEDCLNQSVLAV